MNKKLNILETIFVHLFIYLIVVLFVPPSHFVSFLLKFVNIAPYLQGIIGSGFALQVIEQKKKQHNRKRRRPAAMLIQV